tara:strand:+ start:472 stop:669 length:198 start_codon:yes stop_codon:yes gene_type:complete
MTVKLIDTITTAEMIGLRPKTLKKWRSLLKGPKFMKVGSRVRYYEQDVIAWLDKHTQETENDNTL